MRYLLMLPLFVVLLASCSKSDKELLKGDWTMFEMEKDGKMMMSADPAKQAKIWEDLWNEQKAFMEQMGMTKETFMDNAKKQMSEMGKTTFTFDEKGKVTVKGSTPNEENTASDYTLNEEKKELTIKDNGKEQVYSYSFEDDKITLKQDKDKLVFKRK